jgi:hypothetical protein
LSDQQKSPPPQAQDDATRAVAHLPGLGVEVVHRRAENAEAISIHVQAAPSFDAFGRFLDSELWGKAAGNLFNAPFANPFALWAEAARLFWQPWLNATQALMPPVGAAEETRKLPEK